MKYKTIITYYERLEHLVSKLPSALQKPIQQEMTTVKNLFLLQRAPRIAIAGEAGSGKTHLLNTLFNAEIIAPADSDVTISGWHEYSCIGRGAIRVLDVRRTVPENAIKNALADETPDIFLFVRLTHDVDGSLAEDIAHFNGILDFLNQRDPQRQAVIGVLVKNDPAANLEQVREQLHTCLHTKPGISERLAATLAITSLRFRLDGTVDDASFDRQELNQIAQVITDELPEEARLEMARLCRVKEVQLKIAHTLIKDCTALCAAIGMQPIPVADFPILTALQVMMISGIMHISGREMSMKLAGEFVSALGANVGAGLVLREGSRALAKLLPIWGLAISGAIAGGGTYALGRAATAYFIEGVSLQDAKKLFRRKAKREALRN